MSVRTKLLMLVAKSVIVPFVSSVAGKAGEAVGDLVAFAINPPAPEPEPEPESTCLDCGAAHPHHCPRSEPDEA